METNRLKWCGLFVSIIIVFVLWYVMFVIRPFNFWLMMSISTSLLIFLAIIQIPLISRQEVNLKNFAIGAASAFLLYGIFWMGNQSLILLERILPAVFYNRSENIMSIYANRGSLSPEVVALILFFPIGFGEEAFWRGFVQRFFALRLSPLKSLIITTMLYTAVHIPTGNLVLIGAAMSCGIFWGSMYAWTGRLFPVLVSHMLWDPFIFIILPIH